MDKIAKNLEENKGFILVRSPLDNVQYKILDTGSYDEQIEVAKILSMIRRDINSLLIYLCKNPQLWINDPIAYGIIHTFDIHITCLNDIFDIIINNNNNEHLNKLIIEKSRNNLFLLQEMIPNKYDIIGLNKPRKIEKIKLLNGKDYEMATKRSIHITIRNNGKIDNYSKILDLAIHELTHTTCNDIYWKEDNHKYPYPVYHSKMRQWAKDCGIR
jgi:hypothetical protein